MTINDVFNITARGTVCIGTISEGTIKAGDMVILRRKSEAVYAKG